MYLSICPCAFDQTRCCHHFCKSSASALRVLFFGLPLFAFALSIQYNVKYDIWVEWIYELSTGWILSQCLSLLVISIVFLLRYTRDKRVYDELVEMKKLGKDNGPEYEALMQIYNINAFQYINYRKNDEIFTIQGSKLHVKALTPEAIDNVMSVSEETDTAAVTPMSFQGMITWTASAAAKKVVNPTAGDDDNISYVIKKKTIEPNSAIETDVVS